MISLRGTKSYCCDDISLIENYKTAINDKTQTWHCHHRLEIDLNLTPKQLKEKDLYFKRPASELIFLTKSEHSRLHKSGCCYSEETKKKHSAAMTGKKRGKYKTSSSMVDKHHSEETKRKISKPHKGKKSSGMFGKHHSEEAKEKISEKMSELQKGKKRGKYKKKKAA